MFMTQFQKMKLMQLLTSKWLAKPIYVASELGLFDVMSKEAKTISQLAEETKTQPDKLYRLLRAMASFGIFKETKDQCFKTSKLAEILKSEEMQAMIAMFQSGWHDNAWNHITQSIQTGVNAFELGNGAPAFEYFRNNSKAADQFSRGNFIKTKRINAIVNSFDFSNYKHVADIGGGYGGLILDILHSNSNLQGIIMDLEYLKDEAEQSIAKNNLKKRCEFVPGNFFEEIPTASDVYILCNILHDWNDEKAKAILQNCHKAMTADSKLLIIEMIVPQNKQRSVATLMDLEVLLIGDGKERTRAEFHQLIESAELRIEKFHKFKQDYHIIECQRS